MLLTALEFLGLAFFLGMIAGAVLEQLMRPRLRADVEDISREMSDRLNGESLEDHFHPYNDRCSMKAAMEQLWGKADRLRNDVHKHPERADWIAMDAINLANLAMIVARKAKLGQRMPSEPDEIKVEWP